jgi:hypothetical protein
MGLISGIDWRTSLKHILFIAVLLFVAANGEASTKLKESWKNPNYSGQPIKTILALGMTKNLETRADFEVALANKMARPGITTIAGTDILLRPTAGPIDMVYLREQIAANKIDAVVVCRLIKVKNRTVDVPGQPYLLPYYSSFYGYYGAVYPIVYSPDYLIQEKTVQVETNVYSVTSPDGELIWTGTSDTFDPSSAHQVINGLVELVVKELEKLEILPKAGK